MKYHIPVLLKESIDALVINENGVYIDATFGGGGHSQFILQKLGAKGHLYSFDQDEDVLNNLISENERFTFIHHNFKYLKRFLKLYNIHQVDGILADLGVSSHQLDSADRGFSYRFDTVLDMRMNQQAESTAADILAAYSQADLQQLLSQYGELRNARTLAQAIVQARQQKAIRTVGDLLNVAGPFIRGQRQRYLSQLFQALRIEVNGEMEALQILLQDGLELLKPGGRMAMIAYHSIEDRLIKNFFRSGNFEGKHDSDFYGNIWRPFKLINKRAIVASEEEIKQNPRARSAKLRIAEKIADNTNNG